MYAAFRAVGMLWAGFAHSAPFERVASGLGRLIDRRAPRLFLHPFDVYIRAWTVLKCTNPPPGFRS